MPSVLEMVRQELHAAKQYLQAGMPDFALDEIEHAVMLLSIVHKKERGPMTEAEGMAWYRQMALESEDPFARKVYARIADDEIAHVEFIENGGKDKLMTRVDQHKKAKSAPSNNVQAPPAEND